MSKKIIIFPVSKADIPLIRFFNFSVLDFKIDGIFAGHGSGLVGKDIGFADNRGSLGYIVRSDIISAINSTDGVLITGGSIQEPKHKKSVEIIKKAIVNKKDVFCLLTLDDEVVAELKNMAIKLSVRFEYYGSTNCDLVKEENRTFMTPVPIFLIAGTTKWDNSLEVLLGLTVLLRKMGKRVSAISFEPTASLFNVDVIPQTIYRMRCEPENIISRLNYRIKEIYENQYPEIMLLQAPDTIMRYSKNIHSGYGIKTYMLCQGMLPDYCIACLHSYLDLNDLPRFIGNDISTRLGVELIAVNLCNTVLDYAEIDEMNSIDITYCNEEDMRYQLSFVEGDNKIPVFNCMSNESLSDLANMISDFLC